jgi:hypothetical protein
MRQDEYRDKVETESTCSSNPTAVMVKELSPSALECNREKDNFRGPDDDAGTALAQKGRSPTPAKLRH